MRILVVAEQYPWPAVDGYRQRLHHLISGLRTAGEVEVLALDRRPPTGSRAAMVRAAATPPQGVTVRATPHGPDAPLRSWIGPWLREGRPRRVLSPDWSSLERALTERVRTGPAIDLIWYSHVDTWSALHDCVDRPEMASPAQIVDFDNLEHLALRLRRTTPPRFDPDSGTGARARSTGRWAVSRAFDLVDERRWDRLQRRSAASVDHVVVCSDLDVARSGCWNAVVIGNGSMAPTAVRPDRRALRGEAPSLFFVGALDYEPNSEAVEWFVREVLPLVRAEHPRVRVRIVGRGAERVAWLGEQDGVDLIGPVDDLDAELDLADISIVPIRVGAGTRLKVIEALANRLPLVTTTVGAEGIEVTDGVDALVADDAGSFARAVGSLIDQPDLRQRVADAGVELFERRYDWSGIEDQVGRLVRRTVQERSRRTAGE